MQSSPRGFLSSLFDFSFESLVTPRIIRVLYIISVALIGLAILVGAIGALAYDGGVSVVMLILAPVGFLIGVIYVRVMLELIMVIFSIADGVRDVSRNTRPVGDEPTNAGGHPD